MATERTNDDRANDAADALEASGIYGFVRQDGREGISLDGIALVAGPAPIHCEDCIYCPDCTERHRAERAVGTECVYGEQLEGTCNACSDAAAAGGTTNPRGRA